MRYHIQLNHRDGAKTETSINAVGPEGIKRLLKPLISPSVESVVITAPGQRDFLTRHELMACS